ncbi:MAG: magnesium transporter CorA family protein [Gammaproteobacteria bacterium]
MLYLDKDPLLLLRVLIQGFGLHPMAVQDAPRERHPPKLEPFDNYVFILLKGLGPDKPDFVFDTIQIAMFVGKRFLITRHADDSPSIDRLWQEVDQDRSLFVRGPDALALRLSRIIVDRYLKKLLGLESRIEVLEQDMINEPRDEMLAELIGYKTQLRKFRRVFLYQVQIFAKLAAHQPPGIRAERVHEINDVYEHQDRANSLATLYYELASDLIDGYISLASHNLNHIIPVLCCCCFMPFAGCAGYELRNRYGIDRDGCLGEKQ